MRSSMALREVRSSSKAKESRSGPTFTLTSPTPGRRSHRAPGTSTLEDAAPGSDRSPAAARLRHAVGAQTYILRRICHRHA